MIFKNLPEISPKNLKLIPQSTVKCAFIDEGDRRNAIWDMFVTKKGRCFFSVCAELYVSESAGLYEYIYETNEIKCCFELDKEVLYARDAVMPSKIHTSMAEMNDGRIIMTTHTTSQSRVHPYWYPEPFFSHVFEGYQGSNILIYDPERNFLENRGVPIAHESIYGGALDPVRNAYYFTGYFKGHLYRYDIDTGEITDYGKVTEFGSFRLHYSEIDGNIYSASRSGYFYRINTQTQQIEELGIFFEKDYEPYSTQKHVQLDYIADGKDGNIYLKYIFGYNIYRYNIKENKLECVGDGRPEDLELSEPNQHYGLAVDDNGVLWYTLSCLTEKYDWANAYLIRWDILKGEKPKNMGLVGSKKRSINVMAEMHFHNGVIYLTNGNHFFDIPGMFAIDVKKLEGLSYDLAEDNPDTPFAHDILNYMHVDEPQKYYPYGKEEFSKQHKVAESFISYSEKFGAFMKENPMEIRGKKITPYPLWHKYGYKNSAVRYVKYTQNGFFVEFGENEKFRINSEGEIERIEKFTEKEIPEGKNVPYAAGRFFRAKVTAGAKIFDNKYLLGTLDGLLFVSDGESSFNLGACPNTSGEIRDICYCEKTRTAYGIAGGKNDINIVFSFNEREGVRYLGRAHFNVESGLYLNNELSSIDVSDDGTKILIGSDENMGAFYEIEL